MEAERPLASTLEDIQLQVGRFHYVKKQLMGGAVYASNDKSLYLRTGSQAQISHEVELTQELYRRGFPVPELTEHGQLPNGQFFYVEKAIGDRVFGDIFRDETKERGHVSDVSFEEFTSVMEKYARAQFSKENALDVPHSLDEIVALANVLRNNPPSESNKADFDAAYERARSRVSELPWTHIQGDLNAFNVLHDGIIDFELSGSGPAGYDVIGTVYFGAMWPKDRIAYAFTDEQVEMYLNRIDAIAIASGLPPVSDYREDFLLLKSIWATMKDKDSEDNPNEHADFWRWRVNVRDWAVKQYLTGTTIDPHQFERVGSGVQ